jgi:hypothetical protein
MQQQQQMTEKEKVMHPVGGNGASDHSSDDTRSERGSSLALLPAGKS